MTNHLKECLVSADYGLFSQRSENSSPCASCAQALRCRYGFRIAG